MKAKVKNQTIVTTLNKLFRVPQRISHTTLSNNTVVRIETFKNKRIINVYANINSRFMSGI